MESVTYADAEAAAAALTGRSAERAAGRKYMLPTEDQNEFACGCRPGEPFPSGVSLDARHANFDWTYPVGPGAAPGKPLGRTTPVTRFPANAAGLLDIIGNVKVWCRSVGGRDRVARGGSWNDAGENCRPRVAPCGDEATESDTIGLRDFALGRTYFRGSRVTAGRTMSSISTHSLTVCCRLSTVSIVGTRPQQRCANRPGAFGPAAIALRSRRNTLETPRQLGELRNGTRADQQIIHQIDANRTERLTNHGIRLTAYITPETAPGCPQPTLLRVLIESPE